jgi:hypothetical protein
MGKNCVSAPFKLTVTSTSTNSNLIVITQSFSMLTFWRHWKKGPQHHIIGFKGIFLLIPKSFVKVRHNLKCIFLKRMLMYQIVIEFYEKGLMYLIVR